MLRQTLSHIPPLVFNCFTIFDYISLILHNKAFSVRTKTYVRSGNLKRTYICFSFRFHNPSILKDNVLVYSLNMSRKKTMSGGMTLISLVNKMGKNLWFLQLNSREGVSSLTDPVETEIK